MINDDGGLGINILNHRMQNKGFRPSLHKSLYPSLRKLIEDCWQNTPADRPTFDEITKRFGGAITEEVNSMSEPDFTIEYTDNEEEAEDQMLTNRKRFDSTEAFTEATDKAAALEARNKMLEELLKKVGNGDYANDSDELKNVLTEAFSSHDTAATNRLPSNIKSGGVSVEKSEAGGGNKVGTIASIGGKGGTIAIDNSNSSHPEVKKKGNTSPTKGGDNDGIANIMNRITTNSANAKKSETSSGNSPKRNGSGGNDGVANIMNRITTNSANAKKCEASSGNSPRRNVGGGNDGVANIMNLIATNSAYAKKGK